MQSGTSANPSSQRHWQDTVFPFNPFRTHQADEGFLSDRKPVPINCKVMKKKLQYLLYSLAAQTNAFQELKCLDVLSNGSYRALTQTPVLH